MRSLSARKLRARSATAPSPRHSSKGRVGENNASGVWGGVKLYFGPTDQPLIARHRNEDPNNWNVDNLFGILGNHATTVGSARTCTLGRDLGNKGNCENPGGPSTKGK